MTIKPEQVIGRKGYYASKRNVEKQKERLETEGQIEPIQVKRLGDKYIVQEEAWVYTEAQVQAAIELKWETILATEDEE